MDSSTLESQTRPNNFVTYKSPFTLYFMAISPTTTTHRRIAVGSFIEEYANRINILTFNKTPSPSNQTPTYPSTTLTPYQTHVPL
ncbi:putative protein TRANSPARENT TESTA GLABRA 1 [Helianthus annuus]|nr:putative protein TRANSPARENT TESTA GLABRA 1 [Helianthus annuus]